jgi:hypothetical protein
MDLVGQGADFRKIGKIQASKSLKTRLRAFYYENGRFLKKSAFFAKKNVKKGRFFAGSF